MTDGMGKEDSWPSKNPFIWANNLPQHVFNHALKSQNDTSVKHVTTEPIDFASSTLLYPIGIAILSLLILVVQTVLCFRVQRRTAYTKLAQTECSPDPPYGESRIASPAEPTKRAQPSDILVFVLNVVRVASALALSAISLFSESRMPADVDTWNLKMVSYVGSCFIYFYAFALSGVSLVVSSAASANATRHFTCIMFTAWLVYAYRDLWPLATFTTEPLDRAEGAVLWVRVALLTINGILIPLLIPRRYVPFDPKHPWANPPPEQTTSILSNLLFGWLDPTIRLASRVEHLSLDMLPALADYDDAQNLLKCSELDPFRVKTKGRHLMWGLLRVFKSDLVVMSIAAVTDTALEFVGPLAIKYVETGGEGAAVRPWFWIVALMLGSILDYVIGSVYIFRSSRMMVRVEAIITQLVFEHALRMRVKADVKDVSDQEDDVITSGVPGVAPTAGSSVTVQEINSSSNVSDTSANNSKQKSMARTASMTPPRAKNLEKSATNMAGRVNNLITSDLASLVLCREFLAILLKLPIKVAFSALFLYSILGWSALVGLSSIVVLVPVASAVMTLTHTWQVAKMKKTDARVQTVTESISVIRMIKLFGWEPRVAVQLYGEREEELILVKKSKLLSLINNNINHIIPLITMLVTYSVFTVIMKRDLTASVVFSTMTVFNNFSHQLQSALGFTPQLIRAKVSLDRVDDFLQKTELLDVYSDAEDRMRHADQSGHDEIGIRNASFKWSSVTTSGSLTPVETGGRRHFVLGINGDLFFKKGCVNLIIGPTGSGKSSLLMALLSGVAYAAQESWVQNETIRDNILFGVPFEEDRYRKVIEQCALKHDLELFAAGDKTEVGERGITLR